MILSNFWFFIKFLSIITVNFTGKIVYRPSPRLRKNSHLYCVCWSRKTSFVGHFSTKCAIFLRILEKEEKNYTAHIDTTGLPKMKVLNGKFHIWASIKMQKVFHVLHTLIPYSHVTVIWTDFYRKIILHSCRIFKKHRRVLLTAIRLASYCELWRSSDFFSWIIPVFHEESKNTTLHIIHRAQRVAAS